MPLLFLFLSFVILLLTQIPLQADEITAEQAWIRAAGKMRSLTTFAGSGPVSQNRPDLGNFVWSFRNSPDGVREDRKEYPSAFAGNRSLGKKTILIENRQGRWKISEFGEVIRLDFENEDEGDEIHEERLALGLDRPHTYSFRSPTTIGGDECIVLERRRSDEMYERALTNLRTRVGLSTENKLVLRGASLEDKISVSKIIFVRKSDMVVFGDILENKKGKIIGGNKCEIVHIDQELPDSYFAVPTNATVIVAGSIREQQRLSTDELNRAVGIPHTASQKRPVIWVLTAITASSLLFGWTVFKAKR